MNETNIRKLCALLDIDDPVLTPGGWLNTQCPFASEYHAKGTDRTPSFRLHINPHGRSGFHCWSCKEKGDLTSLVHSLCRMRQESAMHLAGVAEAMETEIEFEGFETMREEQQPDEALDIKIQFLAYRRAWDDPAARAYLKSRGVSKETAEVLSLRYDPDRGNIMFPVQGWDGALYGFAGRAIDPAAVVRQHTYPPLKKSRHLLGEQLVRPGYDKLIVEGQFAYARMVEAGAREFCDVLATMGSHMSAEQAALLIEYGCPVHLLYDDDPAGNIGIYGKWNREGFYEGNGAFDKLKADVPVYIPEMPLRVKGDPDNLTPRELREMLEPNCKLLQKLSKKLQLQTHKEDAQKDVQHSARTIGRKSTNKKTK